MKNKKNKDEENKKSIDFIKQKIESAQWFVDALNQRNQTLLKTMKAILKIQNSIIIAYRDAILASPTSLQVFVVDRD